jgi:hypothetical protein
VLLLEAGGTPPAETEMPAACGGLQRTAVDWAFLNENDGSTEKVRPHLKRRQHQARQRKHAIEHAIEHASAHPHY